MILERYYDTKLAQASYLIGCAATGDALVVDANRDIQEYLESALRWGVKITHVSESHIHADYLSGSRELAEAVGATLYLSDEGDEDWKYGFTAGGRTVPIKDGHVIMVGNVKIQVIHTPGHTPEHVCFLVTDTAGADRPVGLATGDFIFVGDVGRPDLLETAAGFVGTMEAGARTLYASLQRLADLPDYVQIWPGHGAGSACGKALGAMPQSTLGYERLFNWAFNVADEDEFVTEVLEGQPSPPRYFATMKSLNKEGPRLLSGVPTPNKLSAEAVDALLDGGAIVIDTRPTTDFVKGFLPGTISIPLTDSFTTNCGRLLPYDEDVYLIVDDGGNSERVSEPIRDLTMIGLDRMAGYFGSEALKSWREAGRMTGTIEDLDIGELKERVAGGLCLIDVRNPSEWDAGSLHNATNIPMDRIVERAGELPQAGAVALHCQTGARSVIAASLLKRHGIEDVVNVRGGYVACLREGYPTSATPL